MIASDRLTLAAATGLPFLSLVIHSAAGTVALLAGCTALAVRKGGRWHRRSGLLFVWAIFILGFTGVGISLYEGKESVTSGALTAYLVFTAWTTVTPLPGTGRRVDIALMLLAGVFAAEGFAQAFTALGMPGHQSEGGPAAVQFIFPTIILLAAIGDVRMIRAGGLQGVRRLARHLWRMCFGLYVATASFAIQLVRMKFMPGWMRSLPLILVLSAGPLVVLLYWMWRVRVRQNISGLMIAKASAARGTVS